MLTNGRLTRFRPFSIGIDPEKYLLSMGVIARVVKTAFCRFPLVPLESKAPGDASYYG